MMSNDLSKQLCELCGIKPRYGVWVDYGDLDHDYRLVTNERKYRLIADCRYNYGVDDDDLRDLKPEFYPDFTKPENFVRLLKIWLAIFGEFRLERHSMSMEPEEKLITDCLIRTSDDFYPVNKLKQSIREAEWVYD